jgi:DNA polymerase III epsilon subunit-like protein
MYLFFDTETTGLPINWKAPVSDVDNWPRVTQLAWQVYDEDGKLIRERCNLIKPDGWEIPKEAFFIDNNMSTERCEREGVRMLDILEDFVEQVGNADYLIAHNMAFDDKVIGAEMIRANLAFGSEPKKVCTMQESIDFCKIPPFKWGNYKWPKLIELHEKLFNEGFDGAHDALADVKACARSFFELKKRSIILKS